MGRNRNPISLTPPSNKCLYEALSPGLWRDIGRYVICSIRRRVFV